MKRMFIMLLAMYSCNNIPADNAEQSAVIPQIDQTISDSDLAKYSYLIVGEKPNVPDRIFQAGTGFFVKSNGEYLFITAKHIITGLTITLEPDPNDQFDRLGIVCKDTLGVIQTIPFDATAIKKQIVAKYFYEEPDMIVIKFDKLSFMLKIYSIENFLHISDDTTKTFDKIISYGYPKDYSKKTLEEVTPFKYEGSFADVIHVNPNLPKSEIFTIIKPDTKKGMSGAPVFFKYTSRIRNKASWFEFGGIAFSTDTVYSTANIVSQKTALSELSKPPAFTFYSQ